MMSIIKALPLSHDIVHMAMEQKHLQLQFLYRKDRAHHSQSSEALNPHQNFAKAEHFSSFEVTDQALYQKF